MARAASAVPHQPDSTNLTYPPTWLRPLRLYRLDASALPLPPLLPYYPLHPSVHSTAASLPPAPYRAPPSVPPLPAQHDTTPISSPVRSHPVPMSTKAAPAGRRLTSAQRDSLNWCTPPAQRCSTSLFLHAGASRIARLIVFQLPTSTAFSCLINVWLIVFFYCRSLPIQVCFDFTDTY